MTFLAWLKSQGCTTEVYQDDDGSGYFCVVVTLPDGDKVDLMVMTHDA